MANVDQVSLPMRIAFVACLMFASLWFVALRPKPVEDVDAPLPTPAEIAAPKAETKAATKPAPKAAASKPKAAATEPKAKPKAKPAAPTSGPKAVLADIAARRTVVLLFWDPKASSSDDRAVRQAVSDVDRHGGAVRVHVANLDALKGYEPITKAAPVMQTPTVLVIDREKRAHAIEGLTVTREIDTLVDRTLAK